MSVRAVAGAPFPSDKIIRVCPSFSFSVSVGRSSDQSPTGVVLVRELRRGLRVGGGGGVISASFSSGRRRLSQLRRRRFLSPRWGSSLSSAVVGSSSRGVKAVTALRRRLQSPSPLGFISVFSRWFGVVSGRVGGEKDLRRKGWSCMRGFGRSRWTGVDEISPRRSILSDIWVLKALDGEEVRNFGVPAWLVIRLMDLRRGWVAGAMRRSRDTWPSTPRMLTRVQALKRVICEAAALRNRVGF